MTDLPAVQALQGALAKLGPAARKIAGRSLAPNTVRAYRSDLATFHAWLKATGREAPAIVPPELVAEHLADRALGRWAPPPPPRGGWIMSGRRPKLSSLERLVSAIEWSNRTLGGATSSLYADRSLSIVREGLARLLGEAKTQKAPLLADQVIAAAEALPDDLEGTRDRALLLLGFAGAFRRSELVAIDVEHLTFRPDGLVVRLPRSKANQRGQLEEKGIRPGTRACPVAAVKAWLGAAEIRQGAVFREISGETASDRRLRPDYVAKLAKRLARQLGLDPSAFGGHSLRRGLATSARKAGKSRDQVQRTGGWSSAAVEDYMKLDPLEQTANEGLL